ncbi:phage portal protein [Peptostreptococcus equinus]|uniref:Phage portal protein n=1 Tax=Peptostreptococcus equinus TaxID=3003601 RepID=A0ABY7JQ21_9FIRM|nr:phage portal protein [Peptostreptococcus sp. CBA3647]WAW15444.1 phage portal protein [Peptostreptococcus sp. CBA3647]
MFNWLKRGVNKLNDLINKPEEKTSENMTYLEYLVNNFKTSKERENQIIGEEYYKGNHDILNRKKYMILKDGTKKELLNTPNNKRVDNQYAIAVDKKKNYMLGKAPTIKSDNEKFDNLIEPIFNHRFMKSLKNILKSSLNCGIAYVYIYIDSNSQIKFKLFKSYEIYPVWKDEEHNELNFVIRLYAIPEFIAGKEVINEYAEVYDKDKVTRYKVNGKSLLKLEELNYLVDSEGKAYNWNDRVPIVAFKYNDDEIPLINKIKSLQDAINEILSDYNNNMQQDARNTILVITNYDGANLEDFRENLATAGAVKVQSDGGVDTLSIEVNSDNYKSILDILKKALIENAKSFDAKDERLGGNPNQMNIQSMYSDIDLDSNDIEAEFKASFEQMTDFVKMFLEATTDYTATDKDKIDIIFNKDVLINESQVITDIQASTGLLSTRTLLENHPYIDDPAEEEKRLKQEQENNKPKKIEDNFSIGGDNNAEEEN